MRNVEFVPVRATETADIYSIRIDGAEETEFRNFLRSFKDTEETWIAEDLNRIVLSVKTMLEKGVKEYYFRPEGKMSDRVCAIPIYTAPRKPNQKGTLRLYCIRIADNLLILGGGGKKISKTYNEDNTLSEKVHTLQSIDKELRKLENKGVDLFQNINNLNIRIY